MTYFLSNKFGLLRKEKKKISWCVHSIVGAGRREGKIIFGRFNTKNDLAKIIQIIVNVLFLFFFATISFTFCLGTYLPLSSAIFFSLEELEAAAAQESV